MSKLIVGQQTTYQVERVAKVKAWTRPSVRSGPARAADLELDHGRKYPGNPT
jgi:hypothetical protein